MVKLIKKKDAVQKGKSLNKKASKVNEIESKLQNQKEEEDFLVSNTFLENEALNDEEENFDEKLYEEKNKEMIDKLRTIDGKKRHNLRTEVVDGEFDVNITTKHDPTSVHKIKAHELLSSLKGVSEAASLKKMFSLAHKRQKVLETPLPKHITDKSLRIASYIQDKKEVSTWDPIIKKNRTAEQLIFPLKQPDYSMESGSNFSKTWNPETDLEKQIAELLQSSDNNIKDQKLLTPAEVHAFETMNLEEMKAKRSEFLKLKALQSYQEAKFKRLKKIKSKRYRKILRKDREKDEEKDLQKMEKDDPLQFKEVLKEMEKKRMMERMSLKHRNTSKWSKQQKIYAQYSEKAKEQVQDQLELSKQLTKRVKEFEVTPSSDEDEQEENNQDATAIKNAINKKGLLVNNPWMKMMSGVGEIKKGSNEDGMDSEGNDNDFAKPKAFSDTKELQRAQEEIDDESDEESDDNMIDKSELRDVMNVIRDDNDDNKEEDNQHQDKNIENTDNEKNVAKKEAESLKTKLPKNFDDSNENKPDEKSKKQKKGVKKPKALDTKESQEIKEPEKNIQVSSITVSNAMTEAKQVIQNNREKNESHNLTISEAFADDDVIEQFKAEKKVIIDSEKVKAIDLSMPGWGGWAGAGIDLGKVKKNNKRRFGKNNKRLRKKLIINPSEVLTTAEDKAQMVRQDANLEHVIISEKKDTQIAAYQISELPHKYTSVSEFESKISQPVGRTWNPDHKFRKLIAPRVKTRMGAIIEPIDKDDIGNKYKNKKRTSSKK